MRIVIIGGNGTIGKYVTAQLSQDHDVLVGGRKSGDISVDIDSASSIKAMYEKVGQVETVICIAGEAKWAPFESLSENDFYLGIRSKLMGQVNVVRIGTDYIQPGGSFTLTTGILADHPVELTTSAAMVNGAIHSFVKAVSLELNQGMRINAVSSGLVEESAERYQAYFPGHTLIPMEKVVNAYQQSVEGSATGQIIRVYDRT